MEIYLGGRATAEHRGEAVPIHDLAIGACQEWLRRSLRNVDVARDVRIVSRLRPGSADLACLFERGASTPLANDTSCGAGFAPNTELERVVLVVDRALREARDRRPEIGDDVKVLGVRRGQTVQLTIACAFVGRFLRDLDEYDKCKLAVSDLASTAARAVTACDVEVGVNLADDLERGEVYLTVSGTSAEAGDDGQVGRGNRTNGLITPFRPMTMEAAAGKNPVSHVGKLYHLTASRIARSVHREVEGVVDAACVLVSRIGHPIDDPLLADVSLVLEPDVSAPLRTTVAEIASAELGRIGALCDDLLAGRETVF